MDTYGDETGLEHPLRPSPLAEGAPRSLLQGRLGPERFKVSDVAPAWATMACDQEDQRDFLGINLLAVAYAHSQESPRSLKAWAERRA